MLAAFLLGTYRHRVLALLLLQPDEAYHVREIARLTETAPGTLHKELSRLAMAGLLTREKVGNQIRYAANRGCPIFAELAAILRKTPRLSDLLADALAPLASDLRFALLHGAVARGEEHPGGADLLLIGSLSYADAVAALQPVEERSGRRINPLVMTATEFRQKAGESFLRGVLARKRLLLIGDENELARLAGDPAPEKT